MGVLFDFFVCSFVSVSSQIHHLGLFCVVIYKTTYNSRLLNNLSLSKFYCNNLITDGHYICTFCSVSSLSVFPVPFCLSLVPVSFLSLFPCTVRVFFLFRILPFRFSMYRPSFLPFPYPSFSFPHVPSQFSFLFRFFALRFPIVPLRIFHAPFCLIRNYSIYKNMYVISILIEE